MKKDRTNDIREIEITPKMVDAGLDVLSKSGLLGNQFGWPMPWDEAVVKRLLKAALSHAVVPSASNGKRASLKKP